MSISAAFPAWVLLGVAISLVTRNPLAISCFALSGLAARTWWARTVWTPQGSLGWANGLTWLRVLATASLVLLDLGDLVLVVVAFIVFALDGVDGALARRFGTSSAFGAELDKECDAFYIVILCYLLWTHGVAGIWVLIPGLWRYLYGLLLAAKPALRPVPRSQWARYTYSTSSLCLMAALIPGNPIAVWMAGFATFAISASFIRSIYYSFG